MEVVGVLASVVQLLDQSITLVGRFRKACQRQKALPDIFAQHDSELNSLKSIIGVIEEEEALRTAEVNLELSRLKEVEEKLFKFLTDLRPKLKSSFQQFAHLLIKGSHDESKLCNIMNELAQVKSMLLLRIQLANVGVMRGVQEQLVANTEIIMRVDELLREEIDDCEGLKIARLLQEWLLQGRRPLSEYVLRACLLKRSDQADDGTIPVTDADLESLRDAVDDEDSGDETLVGDSDSDILERTQRRALTERIILKNMAEDQALQINATVGKDIWKGIDRMIIKDNKASGGSVQINCDNTLEDILALLKATENVRLASVHSRRDSVLSPL